MNRRLKIAIKLCLYFGPRFLHDRFHRIQERQELATAMSRARRTRVSKEEFSALLEPMKFDCDLFLHTSMMNVGKMQGGAKFIATEILNKVDTEHHTLLISALPYRGGFKEYLEHHPVFDVRSASVAMGAVNEYLADYSGARRSVHPTHSVIAIGKEAEEYTAEHHLDTTPFGNHSPYYKLLKNKGKILLLGATLNNVTFVHAIEDLLGDLYPVRCYYKKVFDVECIDSLGNRLRVKTVCHDPLKAIFRDLSFLHDALLADHVMEAYSLGESEMMLIDAQKFALFYLNLLQQGRSIYGKHKVSRLLYEKIENLKKQLING